MAVNPGTTGVSRPFYTVSVKLVQRNREQVSTGDEGEASSRVIDVTHYINKLQIVKSLTVLTPVLVLDMAPSILVILNAGIIEEDFFRVEIFRSTALNEQGGLVFKGDVFIDDFDMAYSLAQGRNTVDPTQERTTLSFFCKPTYFNKLLVHPENKVYDVKDKNVFEFTESLMKETWGKEFKVVVKPSSSGNGHYNKEKFDEDRMLVHKTTLIDYIRYLNQRWGLFPQAALFFTDFPELPNDREYSTGDSPEQEPIDSSSTKDGANSKIGQINLFNYGYLVKKSKNALTVVLANDTIQYKTAKANDGTPIIYISGSFKEVRETPSRIMKSKTTVNFLSLTRDNLYDVDKRTFEGLLEKLVLTRDENIFIRDFWKLEKSCMTNSVRNNKGKVRTRSNTMQRIPTMAQACYFGDEFSTFRFFTFYPSTWTPWGEIGKIGKRVHVRSDIKEYTKRFDSSHGDYIIYKVDLVLSRSSGGEEIWNFSPTVTLARQ